jgi:hypothetical protein
MSNANNIPPIPQDPISENFKWRDWLRNLGNYIQVAQTGGSPWTIVQGGTGASTASGARHNLGLGDMALQNSNSVTITGGTVQADLTGSTIPYGSFSSTQTQTLTATNTPTKVTLNNTDYNNGVTLSSNRVTVTHGGLYNVQFSVQLTNTDTQQHDMDIWFRKNGTDVTNSASVQTVTSTHGGQPGYTVIAANFFVRFADNDYIEAWWCSNSTQVQMNYLPAITTPFVSPGAPSVVLTFTYVSK